MGKRWIPLVADPDVKNQARTTYLMRAVHVRPGVTEGEAQFYDVYGLEGELLAMVLQPVLAVIFLYPFTSLAPENAVNLLLVPGCS